MQAEQVTPPVAHHGEGPVWDDDGGRLLWVDLLRGDVIVHVPGGTEFERHHVGAVAGCLRSRRGGGFVIAVERGFVLTGPELEVVAVLPPVWSDAGVRMNDGACDPQGRFYAGSMAYDERAGAGALFRLDPDLTVHRVRSELTIANGLGWTPDGITAYHIDSPTLRVDALGSVNPAFASPGAVAARGAEIVSGFVASFTLGVGQFCTKPGLLFLPERHGLSGDLVNAIATVAPAPMLGDWIEDRYRSALEARQARPSLTPLAVGGGAALLGTTLAAVASDPSLLDEECFGPASIVVEYPDDESLLDVAAMIGGSLTAAVHAEPDESAWTRPLLEVLRRRVGRVVFNGWPTGVAVSPAMHHGGPWPAATSPLHSSVGGNAIARFLRPTCFQDVPDELLPPALQEANPLNIRRRIDGELR